MNFFGEKNQALARSADSRKGEGRGRFATEGKRGKNIHAAQPKETVLAPRPRGGKFFFLPRRGKGKKKARLANPRSREGLKVPNPNKKSQGFPSPKRGGKEKKKWRHRVGRIADESKKKALRLSMTGEKGGERTARSIRPPVPAGGKKRKRETPLILPGKKGKAKRPSKREGAPDNVLHAGGGKKDRKINFIPLKKKKKKWCGAWV